MKLKDQMRPTSAFKAPEQDVQYEHRSEPLRLRGHSSDTGANPLAVLSFQPKRAFKVLNSILQPNGPGNIIVG
jgi:hypothetical protein